MSKRLIAALLASLTFAAVLAVVPLASPAAAHPKTKLQCAYDPFAGNQCWRVSVAHTHTCPAGTTGTYPNCKRIERDDRTSGQAAEDEKKRQQEEAKKKAAADAADAAKKKAAEEAAKKKAAEDAKKKKKADQEASKCPPRQTGTPPNCKTPPPTTQPPVTCKTGEHRYGNGCHTHGFDAPCGTGTWVPHTGHTPIQQKPCPSRQDSKTTTYTVKPCTPHQAPTERYQRHKHTLANGSDETECHRADVSHCPAGHTETGGHGAQKCRKNDAPDNPFTRIQHLLEKGGKAALEAIVETLQNEAADQLTKLDIDWKNFATDADEQQKLLDVLNPMLTQNNIETYTLDDVKNLWADIEWYGRAGVGNAACGIAVEATLAKLTKGNSLKKGTRRIAHIVVDSACAVGAAAVPVPDADDNDDTDGKSGTKGTRSNRPQPETSTTTPPPTTTTPPKVTKDQVDKAREKWWNGEMDYYDFIDLNNRYKCDSGQIKCSG